MKRRAELSKLHAEQKKSNRKAAHARRDNMKKGDAHIVEDYVNHHDHDGQHVKCLIWIVWLKEHDDFPPKIFKIRHFCSDKGSLNTDQYFTADVWDFELKPKTDDPNTSSPGIFELVTRLGVSLDHGSHFTGRQLLVWLAGVWRKYGKEPDFWFYPSYHACGMADAKGGHDKQRVRADLRNHISRRGAAEYAEMVNSDHDIWSFAFEFKQINRSKDVFVDLHLINAAKTAAN